MPKGAFYAFPNITATGLKSKPFASALLEKAGVATIGGPDWVLGEGYLRISYAASEDAIETALERIASSSPMRRRKLLPGRPRA